MNKSREESLMKRATRAKRRKMREEELKHHARDSANDKEPPNRWMKLKKAVKPVDAIILIVSLIYLTALLDFRAMALTDVFYLTAIIMWAGSFLVRLYLLSRRGDL